MQSRQKVEAGIASICQVNTPIWNEFQNIYFFENY